MKINLIAFWVCAFAAATNAPGALSGDRWSIAFFTLDVALGVLNGLIWLLDRNERVRP